MRTKEWIRARRVWEAKLVDKRGYGAEAETKWDVVIG